MRSGKMRYRLEVQRPHDPHEARRSGPTKWQTVHVGAQDSDGKIWAAIRQQRVAAQNPTSKQLAIVGSYEIRAWSIDGIDETWRFLHGDRTYNIQSIDRPNHNSRELVIIASRDKLKA